MDCKKVTIMFNSIADITVESAEVKRIQRLVANNTQVSCVPHFKNISLRDMLKSVRRLTFDSISSNCFFNLTNLRELTINKTNLIEIKMEMFESLTSLEMLDISNNLISFFEANSFNSLLKLEKLNLSYNNIVIIQANLLKNLTNLKELYLDNEEDIENDQMIVEYNAFDSLKNLEVLRISCYRLPIYDDISGRISPFLSQSSKFLICLDNKPTETLFKNLTQLKKLSSSTHTELGINELNTLTKLEELSVKFKSDKSLQFQMFDLMTSLKILSIVIRDDVEKIDSRLFSKLCNLEELSLCVCAKQHAFSASFLKNSQLLKKLSLKGMHLNEDNITNFQYDEKVYEKSSENEDIFHIKSLKFTENRPLERLDGEHLFTSVHKSLRELDLETNPDINKFFKKSVFDSLINLKILNLDTCNLRDEHFENFIFENCSHLEELYLNDNLLERINSDWFRTLNNLKVLSIEMNGIRDLHADSFKNLKKLEELNLRNNRIERINQNIFNSQTILRNLILSDNDISYFDELSFDGLTHCLEELDIRANRIVSVKQSDFRLLSNLKVLLVNRQKANMDFDPTCLRHLKQLKHLFIHKDVDLKEYLYFEQAEIRLYTNFTNSTYFKNILNNNFLIEKDFD